jgi:prophage regulatory protein
MTLQVILRRSQLEEKLGLTRSTIYKLMQDNEFPRPIKIGRRAVGWPEKEVNAWLDAKFAEREASND